MKTWQYFAIQANLMIILALVSTLISVKIIFMLLAVGHIVAMLGAFTNEAQN